MKYNKEILNRFLNNEVTIAVRTSKEWDKLMQLLEKETEVTWTFKNPTELNYWSYYDDDSSITCDNNKLAYGDTTFHRCIGYEIIEFQDLIEVAGVLQV